MRHPLEEVCLLIFVVKKKIKINDKPRGVVPERRYVLRSIFSVGFFRSFFPPTAEGGTFGIRMGRSRREP